MSNYFKNGYFAFGLVVGIGVTLIIGVFGEHLYKLVQCIAGHECNAYPNAQEQGEEPEWWYWTRRIVSAEDTLAQWVMSIFSIIAVALIWITLSHSKRAANYTQQMLDEAKIATKATQDSIKAFLAANPPKLIIEDDGIPRKLDIRITNVGKSPAYSATLRASTFFIAKEGKYKGEIQEVQFEKHFGEISPGNDARVTARIDFFDDGGLSLLPTLVENEDYEFRVRIWVEFVDAFDSTRWIKFAFCYSHFLKRFDVADEGNTSSESRNLECQPDDGHKDDFQMHFGTWTGEKAANDAKHS